MPCFPYTIYNMVDHKDAMVADVWDDNREDGGWLPIFLRSLNDWELEEMERFVYALSISRKLTLRMMISSY